MIIFQESEVRYMALTKRGEIIYDYFKQHPTQHPTAEEVYNQLKTHDVTIGVATVYRNLHELVHLGLLKEINLEKQGVRYDLREFEHYHFVCDTCGEIHNFVLDALDQIDSQVEQMVCGKITSKDILFHGICNSCQEK